MAKQGRCYTCGRTFAWPTDVPMKNAQCPTDGMPLHRTVLSHRGLKTVEPFHVTTADVKRTPSKRHEKDNPQLGQFAGPGSD